MSLQLSIFNGNEDKKFNEDYYVYILINSLNNEIIYVGKGKGNRINQHILEFYEITKYQHSKITSLREVRDKRKFTNYKKLSLFLEILNKGGEIVSRKIYTNLSEKDSFKIEQLIIFFLKRRIDYLYSQEFNGIKYNFKKKWVGKLLNKSVGGYTGGERVKTECVDLDLLLKNYKSVKQILAGSIFIKEITTKNHPNNSGLINYSSINEYLVHQIRIIKREIENYKKRNGIQISKSKFS